MATIKDLVDLRGEPFVNAPAKPIIYQDVEEDDKDELLNYIINELATERGFLELGLDSAILDEQSPDGKWEWAPFQLEYFGIPGWFACNKCRQGGGSVMLAAKYFAKGMLAKNNYNGIFVSYKKEEAVGKINYVRMFLQALPPRFKKRIIRDPHHLIEFENHNGTRVKLTSHAMKPVRGTNGDVGLDELAFYAIAKLIYNSALPAVASVGGNIDVISTPWAKSGVYYEIIADKMRYPDFTRMPIMWWHVPRYLKPQYADDHDSFIRAIVAAARLDTEDRVYRFGNSNIQTQFQNMDIDTFRQEFEGHFVDAQAKFFYKDLILSCIFQNRAGLDEYAPEEKDFSIGIEEALKDEDSPIEAKYAGRSTIDGRIIHFKKYTNFEELLSARRTGEISNNLLGAADIGTTIHSAHFVILEELILPDGDTLQIERFSLNRRDWKLPDQQDYYEMMMRNGYLRRFASDANGIGLQMAQHFEKHFPRIYFKFKSGGSAELRDAIMTNLKARLEAMKIALYSDRVTIDDLYAIERRVAPGETVSYHADEKKRHHGDAAWAVGMASFLGTPSNEKSMTTHNPNDTTVQTPAPSIIDGQPMRASDIISMVNSHGLGLSYFPGDVSVQDTFISDYDK